LRYDRCGSTEAHNDPADILATTTAPLLRAQRQKHPNLLFILADTWRGVALPSIDSNLKATNLTRLAREGTDCRRTYTSYAVCCPSRATILTGRFPRSAGVTRNHSLLPLAQPTMSAALKQVGYRTGYIGKWHLDGGESPGFVPLERRRGFDYWAATNLQHKHYGSVYFRDTPAPIPAPGFEPDHQTNLAREFISQQSSRPFYLYVSYVALPRAVRAAAASRHVRRSGTASARQCSEVRPGRGASESRGILWALFGSR
jgi:arylsulfatase A-like enzyme